MFKLLEILLSIFGLPVLLGFFFIGVFIVEHWQVFLAVLLFLGLLLLGISVFIFIGTLAKDNTFKEGMGDFLTWIKWGIIPEVLRSEELKDKIKMVQVKYDNDSKEQ